MIHISQFSYKLNQDTQVEVHNAESLEISIMLSFRSQNCLYNNINIHVEATVNNYLQCC